LSTLTGAALGSFGADFLGVHGKTALIVGSLVGGAGAFALIGALVSRAAAFAAGAAGGGKLAGPAADKADGSRQP
jgi:hypothetical protein